MAAAEHPLFRVVTRQGQTLEGDTYPPTDVLELTLLRDSARFTRDGIRPHFSHPLHEAAMLNLPSDLVVLRMSGTKVRQFPQIPPTMEELYAEYNYFIDIPDLAYATNLHIMNLGNGRIERFLGALPPALQSLDIENNAFKSFHTLPAPTVTVRTHGNPIPRTVNHHAQAIGAEEAQGVGMLPYLHLPILNDFGMLLRCRTVGTTVRFRTIVRMFMIVVSKPLPTRTSSILWNAERRFRTTRFS